VRGLKHLSLIVDFKRKIIVEKMKELVLFVQDLTKTHKLKLSYEEVQTAKKEMYF